MNRFKEFAKMFNLELEEKFQIKHVDDDLAFRQLCKFTEEGLKTYTDSGWVDEYDIVLFDLLIGKDEVVYFPFKPKNGDCYWYLSQYTPSIREWYGNYLDLSLWKCGNCFRTKEEAETKGRQLMEQTTKEYEDDK